jgi:hypothetical protein
MIMSLVLNIMAMPSRMTLADICVVMPAVDPRVRFGE